jgi:hypothetical protein
MTLIFLYQRAGEGSTLYTSHHRHHTPPCTTPFHAHFPFHPLSTPRAGGNQK